MRVLLAGLLLSVLALVVRGIIGVFLRLLVTTGTLRITCPLRTSSSIASPGGTISSTISRLRRSVAATLLLLWIVSRLLPDFGAAPGGDVGSSRGDIVSYTRTCPRNFSSISASTSTSLSKLRHQTSVLRIESTSIHLRG